MVHHKDFFAFLESHFFLHFSISFSQVTKRREEIEKTKKEKKLGGTPKLSLKRL